MLFKKAITAADKLAFEKSIGRTTLNVLEHPKSNTLTIVEELSRFAEGHEIKQRFYNHIDLSIGKANVNSEVDYLKTISTYRFLGKDVPTIQDLSKYVLVGRVNDSESVEAIAAPKPKPEPTPEPKPEPVKEAAETPVEAAPEAKVLEMPKKEDEPKAEKPKIKKRGRPKKLANVQFDRNISPHVRAAAICIKEVLGAGWKEDKTNTDAVKDMIHNTLHKRADIYEPEGSEPLDSFKESIRSFLTKRLDLAGDDLDVEDGLEDL